MIYLEITQLGVESTAPPSPPEMFATAGTEMCDLDYLRYSQTPLLPSGSHG